MQSLSNDLSILLSTDKKIFDKLAHNANFCICDYLENAALNNEDTCQIDIGIGILNIVVLDDTVKYIFKPSQQLEVGIINTLENQQNLLTSVVDTALVNRLNKLYDNFL